jgi:hypothetical protein
MMAAPRSVVALILLLTLVIMLACGACGTARPTLSGRIVSSMQRNPPEPVPGVVVTVQEAEAYPQHNHTSRSGPPEPGDLIKAQPEILASTVSKYDGTFSIPGAPGALIGSNYGLYRVRFHRDDFRDAIFDFFYDGRNSPPFYLEEKRLEPVPLRPNWADPPSTQPAAPVDVIGR